MKQIIAILKWTWYRFCGDRQDFEKRGNGWYCTRRGGME